MTNWLFTFQLLSHEKSALIKSRQQPFFTQNISRFRDKGWGDLDETQIRNERFRENFDIEKLIK